MASLRALLVVGVAVFAAVGVVRGAASLVPESAVEWPPGLINDRPMRGPVLKTERAPDGDWLLLVGGSSAHAAFSGKDLGWTTRRQLFSGGYPSDVAQALRWTLARLPASRRPTRVVWGLNAVSVIDRQGIGHHPCDTRAGYGRRDAAFAERVALCPDGPEAVWTRVDPWFMRRELTVDALTVWLRRVFGAGDGMAAFAGDRYGYLGSNGAHRSRNIAAWREMGLFAAEGFDARQVAALQDTVAQLQAAQIPLLLVSMPEHSETRAAYGPGVRERFSDLLASTGAPVVDLWDALPDDAFYDQAHPNEVGRPRASRLLGERLRLPASR